MKQYFYILLLMFSASSLASTEKNEDAKLFNCMDSNTFEINSECISQNIQSNLVFQKAQKDVLKTSDNAGDRALATMTFDRRSMTISVIAHRDAAIARVDTAQIKNRD
jgi:hypothetical protein